MSGESEQPEPKKVSSQAVEAHPSLVEYLSGNYYDRVMKVVIKEGKS